MRKIIYVVIFVVTMITLQTVQVNDVIAGQEWKEARGQPFECSIAGTWETQEGSMATIVPLDPTGKRFSIIYDTLPPVLPPGPAINWSLLHGILEKIGSNLYEFTLYRYGFLASDGTKFRKIVVSGLTKFTDCDTRVLTYVHQISGAGLPEPLCQPGSIGYVFRLQLEQPCGDLLDFPEE